MKKEAEVLNKSERKDVIMVDPRNLIIDDSFNVRKDMGDIDELADSIIEIGLQVPLKASKVRGTEQYLLVEGHRRRLALLRAIEKGADIKLVMVLPYTGNAEQRVLTMLATGVGQKSLNEAEQAEAVARLLNFGYSVEDIRKKIGKSHQHVYNLKDIAEAPKLIKDKIASGSISGSAVLTILRGEKDETKHLALVDEAIKTANEGNKTAKPRKATTKHISKSAKRITTPLQKFEEALRILRERKVKNQKVDTLEILMNLQASSVDEIVNLLS